jgi:SAM-dependent methyltransferase
MPEPGALLRSPPATAEAPAYDGGWQSDAGPAPYLAYVDVDAEVNWSEELELLHEESSRDHFIDVWTRTSILERLEGVPDDGVVADVGCSTGYLLEDLRARYPRATLFGADLVASGLPKAHANVPSAALLQADACDLPFRDAVLDGVVSANLLEHVPDDVQALREIFRTLKPGRTAVVVIPRDPKLYDYYDRFLSHERRYARGEMADKARSVGFEIVQDTNIGALLFPPFWLVKKRNRRKFDDLRGDALEAQVARDIARTKNSAAGALACRIERALMARGVNSPVGIRGLTVMRKPEAAS